MVSCRKCRIGALLSCFHPWTMTPNLVTWKVDANVMELSKIFTVLLEEKKMHRQKSCAFLPCTRFPFFMPWQQIEVCYCCKCIFTASSCGRAMQSRLSLKCNLLLKPHIFENRLVPSSIPFGPEAKKQGRVLTNKL